MIDTETRTAVENALVFLRDFPLDYLATDEQDAIHEYLLTYGQIEWDGDNDPDILPEDMDKSTAVDITLGRHTFETCFSLADPASQDGLLNGDCAHLAYFAWDILRLPFVVLTCNDSVTENWTGHVGISLGNNLMLDAAGVRDVRDVCLGYEIDPETGIRIMDESEFQVVMDVPEDSFEEYAHHFDYALEGLWIRRMAREMILSYLPNFLVS